MGSRSRTGLPALASGGIPAGSGGGESALESGSLKLIICLEKGEKKRRPAMGADFESLCLAFIQKDRQEQRGQGWDCAGGKGGEQVHGEQSGFVQQELFLQVSPGKGPARSIFCLVLSIYERGMLKSSTLIVYLFISLFSSISFCFA